MPNEKNIGKFVLDDEELKTLSGGLNATPLQGSSQLLILKDLLDDLIQELKTLDRQRENVLNRILTINEVFKEKVKTDEAEDSKGASRGAQQRPRAMGAQ